MGDHDYAAGKRDGKLEALEKVQNMHESRFEHHDSRISSLEKISYAVLGVIALVQFVPVIYKMLGIQ